MANASELEYENIFIFSVSYRSTSKEYRQVSARWKLLCLMGNCIRKTCRISLIYNFFIDSLSFFKTKINRYTFANLFILRDISRWPLKRNSTWITMLVWCQVLPNRRHRHRRQEVNIFFFLIHQSRVLVFRDLTVNNQWNNQLL